MTQVPPTSRQVDLLFLDGGGEMGALMRELDWSRTPLGPASDWPVSLKTIVSLALASESQLCVLWGTEFIQLYNNGFRPILGATKHPLALGQRARECWREIWPIIEPMYEMVMAGGSTSIAEGLLVLERNGFLEECYFDYTYSPIRDDRSRIGGILAICSEVTHRVIDARRLRALVRLGADTFDMETPAHACRACATVVTEIPSDVPFALIYLLDATGAQAELANSVGLEKGHMAAPATINLGERGETWPLEAAIAAEVELDLDALSLALALPGGTWPEPPRRAVVLALRRGSDGPPYGFLVAGVSPRLPLNDAYRGFLRLIAAHLASAIQNALSFGEEKRRREALAELDIQKTEFFNNVSHEFRTPLTLMLGPVEEALARRAGLSDEPLAAVHRNALRLLKLVNNLLDFARLDAGRTRASFRPVNLAEMTTDLASSFRSAIETAGIVFEIDCMSSAQPVFVDGEMWEKIVFNLLSNALKFTFDGKITIALKQDEDAAVLSVADTGVGIPCEEIPRLFDRFHRVHGSRSRTHEGSGIGLALVSSLAQLHGGTVKVESQVGRGTTFKVTIPGGPRGMAVPQPALSSTEESTATGVAAYVGEALRWDATGEPWEPVDGGPAAVARASRARILIVDDNADMRDYLVRLVRERWIVETAVNGALAVAKARADPPDAIISDMMMPGLDGIGLVRELRGDDRTRHVPILLLSARADEQSAATALAEGASDYIVKPFAARELLARVGAQLDLAGAHRAAMRRLESFLIQAPVAIAILHGPALRFVLANERYEQLVGRRGVVGKEGREALPELVGQGVWDIVDQVFVTGVPFVAESFPVQLSKGHGGRLEEGHFNWTAQPTRGYDGAVDGVMIFAVDVTEQMRAQQRLERASALEQSLRGDAEAASRRAEAASRAKDEFLAMLGHELRNPLAPISTALQLMRMRDDGAGEKERLVIERQVAHLEGLVSDLLDVSRIAQGKIELDRTRFEVAEALTEAVEMASPLLEHRHHRLTMSIPSVDLLVEGDFGRLKQVFANLVTNAAKYTPPNGTIAVEAKRQGDLVVIQVRDNGIGIATHMLASVFDLFSQVPQSLARSEGGLGLGLSIVRSIVELHGGRVYASSEGPGSGSTFVVELPQAPVISEAASRGSSSPIGRTAMPALHLKRILIVDDNQDAAELLSEMLSNLGHTTRVAHDGPSALRAVADFTPDVGLVDIGLPVMDGYELASRLRSQPALRDLHLVAITGYGQLEDRRRSKEAGFDAHLVKPVPIEELAKVLEAYPRHN